jgi:hypothetical protein
MGEPACKIFRIEIAGLDRYRRDRPDALKTITFALKQLVMAFRTTRLVAPDVDDAPSPDPCGARSDLVLYFGPLTNRQIHAAMLAVGIQI